MACGIDYLVNLDKLPAARCSNFVLHMRVRHIEPNVKLRMKVQLLSISSICIFSTLIVIWIRVALTCQLYVSEWYGCK